MRERRFKKAREPRKLILVICEGETEEQYVETLKRHYRLPITIKTKVSGNAVSERLVAQYVNELDIANPTDCRIFYLYDADVESIVKKLRNLQGDACITNPCIEFWFIIHSGEYKRGLSSAETLKVLKASHPTWKNYMKGRLSPEQSSFLIEHRHEAAERSKKLSAPGNPSSEIHRFIEALEEEKNR